MRSYVLLLFRPLRRIAQSLRRPRGGRCDPVHQLFLRRHGRCVHEGTNRGCARRRADSDRPLDTSARSRTAATPAFGIVSKTGLGDIGRNGRPPRDEPAHSRAAQQGMDRKRFSRVPKSGAQESFVSIGSTVPPAFFLTGSDARPPSPASMPRPAIPPLSRPRPRRPWSSSGRCRRPRSCRGA